MIDKSLFALIGDKKKHIYIITALNILSFIANLTITASICYMLYLLFNDSLSTLNLVLYLGINLIVLVAKYVLSILIQKQKNIISNQIKKNLRESCYQKALSLGLNYKESRSKLMQMSIEGVEQLDTYFGLYLPQFFYAMITPIILFVVIVFIEYRTALALLLALPIIPVAIILVRKRSKRTFEVHWERYQSMGDRFLDYIQGMKEIKIYSDDVIKKQEVHERSEEFRKITMKVLVMQLSSITIMDLVAFGGAGIAIVLNLIAAFNGEVTPFLSLFLIVISAEFFLPMRALGSAFHVGMNGLTAGNNILNFLETPELLDGQTEITGIKNISFKNVDFSYDEETPIFKGLNANFDKGLYSIVGKSGVGKSTIINLITRANDINDGQIIINKTNILDVSLPSFYKNLAVVSCNDYIFNDTIKNNFLLNDPNITDREIIDALEKVNLTSFVESVGGLDYVVLEDSENISGGQKQRLNLALNLIKEKDLYIVDEATSNIDAKSEEIIMNNVYELAKNKMVILISHRLHNVVPSKKILYLDNLHVKESGTHKDLMELKADYYNLFNDQKNLEEGYMVKHNEKN